MYVSYLFQDVAFQNGMEDQLRGNFATESLNMGESSVRKWKPASRGVTIVHREREHYGV